MAEKLNTIGTISPEDDLREPYMQSFDEARKSKLRNMLQSFGNDAPAEAEPSPEMPLSSQVGASPVQEQLPDDQGEVEVPWYAGGGTPDAGSEFLADSMSEGLETAGAVASDIISGVSRAAPQAYGGVVDAFGEVDQFMQSVLPIGGMRIWDEEGNFDPSLISNKEMRRLEKEDKSLFDMVTTAKDDSVTGGLIRAGAQFLTGFLPGFSAAKGMRAGNFVASMGAGAIADMVVFDPNEARLSTFLNEVPALEAIVPDYLASHGGDEKEWEGRLKNAIEGAGLGLMTEGLFRAFKYYKKAREMPPQPEADGVHALAARDEAQAIDNAQISNEVTDDMLMPLGDMSPDAPLMVTAKPDETLGNAMSRIREAEARTEQANVRSDALAKIKEIVDAKKRPINQNPKQFIIDETGESVRLAPDQSRAPEGMSHVIGDDGKIRPVGNDLLKEIPSAEPVGKQPIQREAIDDALDELRSGAVSKAKFPARPVSNIVKSLGGIDPNSSFAGDLRSRGVTARSFPGLYKKGGAKSLDNIPASEHEIFFERGLVDGNGYVQEQAFIDALEAEMKGEPWRTGEQQAMIDEIVAPAQELELQLDRLGIDYQNMSNAEVKARFQDILDENEAYFRYEEEVLSRNGVDVESRSLADLETEQRDIWSAEDTQAARDAGVDEAIIRAHQPNKVYINMARINSADDVKALIQMAADRDADFIKTKTRGVVTNEQTLKESSKEYQDITDLLGREPGAMTAAQATAARQIMASSAEQLMQLAKIASSPNAGKVDLYNFRRAASVHAAIQAEVLGARAETARALQSWAMPVGSNKIRTDAINDLIKSSNGGDLQKLATAIANTNDEAAVNTMARQLTHMKVSDAIYSVWVNGLLSGFKTQLVNVMSNAAVVGYAIPERYVAEAFSNAFGKGDIVRGETAAMANGMVQGIREGLLLAVKGADAAGVKDLSELWEQFGKIDVRPDPISGQAFNLRPDSAGYRGLDMVGKLVSIPGTMLEKGDLFFKAVNYRMELHSLAFREASMEGLDGEAFAKRYSDILSNPPTELVDQANKMALVQTFTHPLGETGRKVQNAIASTPLRWAMPFVRTPTNIMKYMFARTPLAYAMSSVRADIAAGGARAAQAHARVGLGSMMMMTFAGFAADGHVTGGGSLDPKINAAQRADGWQPYSVKIGGKWYAYNRLDPLGMMLGMAADIYDVTNSGTGESDSDEVVLAAVTAFAQNLASKTYAQGAFELAAALDPRNPTGSPAKFMNRQASGLIPFSAFLRQTAQGLDPVIREAKDPVVREDGSTDNIASFLNEMVNNLKRGIPGLSDTLPPMRDLFGKPMTRESSMGAAWDMIMPIQVKDVDSDPVAKAIIDNKVKVGRINNIVRGVRLNAQQYDELQETAGRLVRERLEPLVKDKGFQRLSAGEDGMQAELIRKSVIEAHNQARLMLFANNPELRESFQNKAIKNQNLLLGN